jgi:SAM-dependent methyltransferase
MTHAQKIAQWIGRGKTGIEIGAGTSPLPISDPVPIYIDCFREFGHAACRADYYGQATALPFHDHSLDYVASSHVLEHVANPVAALAEWYRVLRPGGIIYLVVPDRRHTWEHGRPVTAVEHLLADFTAHTTACDATHIDEFVQTADWNQFSPETPADAVPAKKAEYARGMHEAVARGEDINIHFHTFEANMVRALIETLQTWPVRRFRWELVDLVEQFPRDNPNGILAVVRVRKTWSERAAADWFHAQHHGDPQAALRADARPFTNVASNPSGTR